MPVNAFVISVDLMQRTMLARDPSLHAVGMTWTTGRWAPLSETTSPECGRAYGTQVDIFISAYQAVNRAP